MWKVIYLPILCIIILSSCDKKNSPGDNYDFSNSLPPYVTISSPSTFARTVKQGASTTVTFQLRTAMQQPVTVYYDITGAFTATNKSVTIDREKTSVTETISIPANLVVAPATSATATLTLTKAVAADGTQLTIGQKNNAADQKVTITITP